MFAVLVFATARAEPAPQALGERLAALWDGGCGERDLDALAAEDPTMVRAAITGADRAWKAAAKPGRARHVVGEWRGRAITYELGLPEGAGPDHPVPAWITPAHPTWGTESPGDLRAPWGGGDARLILHGFNVMYEALGEARYMSGMGRADWARVVSRAWSRALAHAVAHYPIDPDHLVCVGTSASGNACWVAGQGLPDRFAALWPVSAGWHPGLDRGLFGNLLHTAVRVQHGVDDPLIPDEWVRDAVDGLVDIGAPHTVAWLDGQGHGGHPPEVWREGADWTRAARRAQAPARVHLGRARGGPEQAWWLRVPGTAPVVVEATWEEGVPPPGGGRDVASRAGAARARGAGEVGESHPGPADGPYGQGEPPLPTIGTVTVSRARRVPVEIVWRGGVGPGRGEAGQRLEVVVNGAPTVVELVADAITPLREWCRTGDARDLPMGTVRVR